MASIVTRRVTPEEYLEFEPAAEFRHEYRDGEILAMSGASRWHVRLVTNLVVALGNQLRDTHCNVYSTDLRLSAAPARLFTYPDVMVTCGDERFLDQHFDTLLNPVVLIEVLSESTKSYDRGKKFKSYQTLESLRDYLLVAQDEMHVEHWQRQPDGNWTKTEFRNPEDIVKLVFIGAELRVADIYLKVKLGL
jgi:Uma2 family endonuclease